VSNDFNPGDLTPPERASVPRLTRASERQGAAAQFMAMLFAMLHSGPLPDSAPPRERSEKIKELNAMRVVPRQFDPGPFRWARRVSNLYPSAQLRTNGRVFEVWEPATGFVRGRGTSRRAALRAACRRTSGRVA